MLLLFLAFQFFSCDNEPLVGDFPQEQGPGAQAGQFKASVAGQDFIADGASAILSEDNGLIISGAKANGKAITLSVRNAEVGTFSLTRNETNTNLASYVDGVSTLPYVSSGEDGGSGEMKITVMNTVAKTVSGTFNFKGVRTKLDSSGDPVLDGNGDPVMEDVQITNGFFNSIDYMVFGSRPEGGGR